MNGLAKLIALFREDASHAHALTGIRGWAALWVFLYHAWGFAGASPITLRAGDVELDFTPLISLGGAGVSIFFVLSGFLLGIPFAEWQAGLRRKPETGRYFARRVARVFPAYYAQLIVLMILATLAPGHPGIQDWPTLFRHLLMLFMPPPLGTMPINLVWWTLPIEFSFYLALPLLAFLLRPERWWWLLLGSLGVMWLWRHGVAVRMSDIPVPKRVYAAYQLPGAFDMFGIGMLTALLHVHRQRLPGWLFPHDRQNRLALLGLALVFASIYFLYAERTRYWSDYPIFYLWTPCLSFGISAVILATAVRSSLTERLFGNGFMVFAGVISYSLYLWSHQVLDWVKSTHFILSVEAYRLPWLVLAALPISVLVASISFMLVERPFMRLRAPMRA